MAAWLLLCPVLVMAIVEFIIIGKYFAEGLKDPKNENPPKCASFRNVVMGPSW